MLLWFAGCARRLSHNYNVQHCATLYYSPDLVWTESLAVHHHYVLCNSSSAHDEHMQTS